VNIRNIRTHAEFEKVLERINASVRGIVIDAAVSDCASLERFEGLEFVVLEGHRLSRFWNTAKNPQLRMITVLMNRHLQSLEGLEYAKELEYLWISPNVFSMDRYAKFEAQKFKIFEEYGIYLEEGGDIFPYGKGKRIMHTSKQKQRYLIAYNELLEKYKK